MNDHELWETTMDPTTRILKQVTLDEAADADETFAILMGDDVEQRRSFIQRKRLRRPLPGHLSGTEPHVKRRPAAGDLL